MEKENVLSQNVHFFRKLRNEYFEKSWDIFRHLEDALELDSMDTLIKTREVLEHYTETMEMAAEYTKSVVRGLSRKKIKKFRHDSKNGIMEEEIVFVGLTNELLSSGIYLKNRFKTNNEIQIYMKNIKGLQHRLATKKGFISNILDSMEATCRMDLKEIKQIVNSIHKRFEIANKVFLVFSEYGELLSN